MIWWVSELYVWIFVCTKRQLEMLSKFDRVIMFYHYLVVVEGFCHNSGLKWYIVTLLPCTSDSLCSCLHTWICPKLLVCVAVFTFVVVEKPHICGCGETWASHFPGMFGPLTHSLIYWLTDSTQACHRILGHCHLFHKVLKYNFW